MPPKKQVETAEALESQANQQDTETLETLKEGDQVMAGNEGPVMTITEFDGDDAICEWEEDGNAMRDLFLVTTLHKVTLEEVAAECAPTEVTVIKEPCKCYLTDKEYKDYAILMGQVSAEIAQAEADLTAVKSRYKNRIDAGEARRNEIVSIIRSGWEDRSVECQLVKDYKAGEIYKVRLDTGEEISRRAMSTDERQRGLDFVEANQEPEGGGR